jgi:hemolysin III
MEKNMTFDHGNIKSNTVFDSVKTSAAKASAAVTKPRKVNDQSVGEEIGNAVSHGIGAALAIAGMVCMIVRAATKGTAIDIVSSAIYGSTLFILFMNSTLYHSITNYNVKKVLRVFDHCSIFLLILGSYTPLTLSLIGGARGWLLFGLNAGCAIAGITLNAIDLKKWKMLSLGLYVIMGWSVVLFGKTVVDLVSARGLFLLIMGGVLYTTGIVFYVVHKKYFHFIWHFFVLAGAIVHFFFFYSYCIAV